MWLRRKQRKHRPGTLSIERVRLKWTLGLFCIGLVVPSIFVLSRAVVFVKALTYHEHYSEVSVVAAEANAALDQSSSAPRDQQIAALTERIKTSPFHRFGNVTISQNQTQLVTVVPTIVKAPLFHYTSPPGLFDEPLDAPIFHATHIVGPENAAFELYFEANQIPFGRHEVLLAVDAGLLIGALVFGFMFATRLGIHHISLAEQQRQFVSAVTHELKTPLTTIQMYSEMMLSERHSNRSKQERYLGYIKGEAARLNLLISNVLERVRLSERLSTQVLVSVSPHELLEAACEAVQPQLEARGFHLEKILPDDHSTNANRCISVNREAFIQIILNLADNALKYAHEAEERTIQIGYRTNATRNGASFFVRDFGPGVSPGSEDSIFEPFVRGKDESGPSRPGLGIGLALVKELVTHMHGTIRVIQRSPGAEFQLEFAFL